MKYRTLIILILYNLIKNCYTSLPEDISNSSAECLTNSLEILLYCRVSRAINNIINNLNKTDKPIIIIRGLEIVPSNDSENNVKNSDVTGHKDKNDYISFLGHLSHYLRTHELNIKFSDLMSSDESEKYLARDLEENGILMNIANSEARKKDKSNSMIMALGLMMSKMMAVMGLGGIGALAMKALGVAMTALMMVVMIGVKSLAHQGNESSHSVQYLTADGHHHRRRRRSINSFRTAPSTAAQLTISESTLSKGNDIKIGLPKTLIYRRWQK